MLIQKSVLQTRIFGDVEVAEDSIIVFEDGIPAFENLKRFIIIDEKDSLFKWLQSVDDKDIAFVIINPFEVVQNYEFDIPDDVLNELEIEKIEDVAVFTIAVIPEDIKETRINLRAPIIINVNKKKGMQVVLDDERYSIRFYLFKNSTNEK